MSGSIPSAPNTIVRSRLLDKLRRFEDYKLTIILAPAGSGKTILAAQFARQIPAAWKVTWQTLRQSDRDLSTLYESCLMALEQVAPGIQELPIPHGYPPAELAVSITEHLWKEEGLILYIVDDVHMIDGSAAAEHWLRLVVEFIPDNCHVVLVSRTVPSIGYTDLLAHNHLIILQNQELNFTDQEIDLLFGHLEEERMSQAQTIASRLDGWSAGVALAARLMREGDLEFLVGDMMPEDFFEALARDSLMAQPLDLQDFMLASSTLTCMTPMLCSQALGLSNGAELLARVQTQNVFIYQVNKSLTYHTLFREFLQRELKKTSPKRFVELHRRAGRWFEQRDDAGSALEHYLAAGVDDMAGPLADRIAPTHFAQDKVESLLNWSEALIAAGIQAPRLFTTSAAVLSDRYEFELSEKYLDLAEQAITDGHGYTQMADVLLNRAMIALQKGDYERAETLLEEPLRSSDHPANHHGRALRIKGLVLLQKGDTQGSIDCLEEALPLYRARGHQSDLSHLLASLVLAYTRAGDFEQAGICLNEAVAIRRQLGGAAALAAILNDLGYYYHQCGDYREAAATLEEGLNMLARVPDRRSESYLLWSLGDLRRDQGAFDEARKHYNSALAILRLYDNPPLHSAILVSLSTLLRWRGDAERAASQAGKAQAIAQEHDLAFEMAVAQAAYRAARADLGEHESALERLEKVAADLEQQGARHEVMGILAVCARVCLMAGDERGAHAHLQDATSLATALGVTQPLITEMAHTPGLRSLIANSETYAPLRRALSRLPECTEVREKPRIHAGETFSLQVYTLGHEYVERDAKRILMSTWQTRTARDVFFFLLFKGPATRADFMLAFWMDAEPSESILRTTIMRARRAVGSRTILRDDNVYLINPDIELWCDAFAFEDFVRQARTLPVHDARCEDLWRKAVNLYLGDYLPSVDAGWAILRRENLREQYLQALTGLGQCTMARRNTDEALELFRIASEIEPYREDVHRATMICYSRRGDRHQLKQHYENMKLLFREELGIDPSPETMTLARRLLQ